MSRLSRRLGTHYPEAPARRVTRRLTSMAVLLASTLLPVVALAQDDPWADVRGLDGLTPAGITTPAKGTVVQPTTARPAPTKPARAKPATAQPLATTSQPVPVAANVAPDIALSGAAASGAANPLSVTPQRPRAAFVVPLPPVRPMPYDAPVAELVGDEPLPPQQPAAGSPAASIGMVEDVTLGATPTSVTPPVLTQALSLAPPAPTILPAPATPAAASLLSWGRLDLPGGLVFSSAIAAEAAPEQAAAVEPAPEAIRNVAPNITPPPQERATASAPPPDAAATPPASAAEAAAPAGTDKAPAQDVQAATTSGPDGQPTGANSAEAGSVAVGASGTESSEAKASEATPSETPAAAPTTDTKAAPEAPPAPPIYRALRQLQRLQDRMARGEPNALDEQNALLIALDLEFRSVDVSAWKDPNNARALVLYVLSGGSPKTVRSVLANGADPGIDPRLVRGALAYVEGREADAIKDLGEIDARALPASLAGQVALAQAALWVRRDQAKAAVLLDQARVLAPGTLVEEGALRRAILIAAQGNDLDSFERLTAAYLGRFRHSVYAGNFRQRFAAALTRMSFIDDPALFHRIEDVLRPIEPEGRRDILLVIAQGAVVQGKTAAAVMAAERVLKSAPVGSLDAERASLYRGAAMAASATEYETAARQLRAISRDRLSTADLQLLDTALAVVTSIEQSVNVPPAVTPSTAAPEAPGSADKTSAAEKTAGAKDNPESVALGRARDLLDSTGKLLAEAPL